MGIPEARDRRRACLRSVTLPRRIHLWMAVFDTPQIPAALVGPPTAVTARSTALFFFFVPRFILCHLANRRQSISEEIRLARTGPSFKECAKDSLLAPNGHIDS